VTLVAGAPVDKLDEDMAGASVAAAGRARQWLDAALDRLAATGTSVRLQRPVPANRVPPVTVVIPCYNYGHYLPAVLASVLDQPGVAVDVVVVDDASPDGSGEVAEALAAHDPRITVVRHVRNRGHIATYNDGLERVSGDYVALLSADDLLTPGALARATGLLEANPSVAFAYGRVVCFGDGPMPVARTEPRSWVIWPGEAWLAQRWRSGRNCIWSPEVVMRSSVQREIGGYRPELPHSGDMDMWMRAAAVGDVGLVAGVDQAYYRFHGSNMHATSFGGGTPAGVLVDLRERAHNFEQLATEIGADGLPAARHAVAKEALKVVARTELWDADHDVAEQLVAFAADLDPAVVGGPWWRAAKEMCRTGRTWNEGRDPFLLARLAWLGGADRARRLRWERLGG
jgi:hypothetical protein